MAVVAIVIDLAGDARDVVVADEDVGHEVVEEVVVALQGPLEFVQAEALQ